MDNYKDQIELGKIISQTTELPQATVDAFVKHLFAEIKNNLEPGSSVNVGGLGIFRVIKSGDSNKILFLGSKKNITETIDPASFKEELEGKTVRRKAPKDILATSAIDKTYIKPSAPILTEKSKKKDLVDKIGGIEILTEAIKADNLKKEESVLIENNTALERDNNETDFSHSTTNSEEYKDEISESTKVEINKDSVESMHLHKKAKPETSNNGLRKRQLDREDKKKGAIALPIFIALLIIIAIAGVGFLFFESTTVDKNNKPATTQTPVAFEELAVTDSVRFSYIIIPDKDVSLEYIANHYYGNEIFWPYIYIENEAFMANSTIVSAGSIIKVPKLMIDLADYNDGSTTTAAQIFGDEIKKTRKIY